MTPNFWAPACTHPSPMAAIALRVRNRPGRPGWSPTQVYPASFRLIQGVEGTQFYTRQKTTMTCWFETARDSQHDPDRQTAPGGA